MKRSDKGQVTIFIILGIMIVIAGILVYVFYPGVRSETSFDPKNPSAVFQNCLEDKIKETAELISTQGGSVEPEHYVTYNEEKIEYLCYTGEYYVTCVVQQPMLESHIEKEIKEDIKDEADLCADELVQSYESRGYNVNLKKGDFRVELLPKRISVVFNHTLTLSKETEERYNSLEIAVNNNLYELVSIANSIIGWEAEFGDAEVTTYMNYYRDLKVEKFKQSDGTTIYIITDRNNGNKFQFASRSVAWPPGYPTS